MSKKSDCGRDQEGFVLVTSLLIMLVLTIIGIAANRNTSTELKIAGNDLLYKKNFYEADGVTELAAEVLEQNVACLDFETTTLSGADGFNIQVDNDSLGFWRNFPSGGIPSDLSRDFYFPDNDDKPHTNVKVGGNTKLTTGAAIQMAAGYEGLAKGIGTGGAELVYDINVQRIDQNNTETVICTKYRHVLGQEGECNY